MADLEIVAYDSRWPLQFLEERDRIAAALGALALRIEHHGSTSVPGLAAKPVIDIQVSVRNLRPLSAYAEPLIAVGYQHVPHDDDAICPYFHKPAAWPHTHHVHVVMAGGENERETLAFRDYLRDHPEVAREYGELKQQLAAKHAAGLITSQEAYASAKGPFIAAILERALAAGISAHHRGP